MEHGVHGWLRGGGGIFSILPSWDIISHLLLDFQIVWRQLNKSKVFVNCIQVEKEGLPPFLGVNTSTFILTIYLHGSFWWARRKKQEEQEHAEILNLPKYSKHIKNAKNRKKCSLRESLVWERQRTAISLFTTGPQRETNQEAVSRIFS